MTIRYVNARELMEKARFPFRSETETGICLVEIGRKQICTHHRGCYQDCSKYLEAAQSYSLNEFRLLERKKERIFVEVQRSD